MQTRQKQVRFVCHHSDTSDNLLLCIPTITFWVLVFVNSVPLCFVLLESGQFKCSELKSGHLLYGLEKLPLKRKISVTLFTRAAKMFTPSGVGSDVTPYLETKYAQYTMGQVRLKIIIFSFHLMFCYIKCLLSCTL